MAAKTTLLDETERLVEKMVRDARKPRQIGVTSEGQPNMVLPDLADQAKVATVALQFLTVKHKIAPEELPSEFEHDVADLHDDPGEGDGPARPSANGADARRARA